MQVYTGYEMQPGTVCDIHINPCILQIHYLDNIHNHEYHYFYDGVIFSLSCASDSKIFTITQLYLQFTLAPTMSYIRLLELVSRNGDSISNLLYAN